MGNEDRLNKEGYSQPGDKEVQRLQRESTESKPGETPGADREDGPEPGTEGV